MKDMEKIRILHFELDSNLGGIETFLLNVTKIIDKSSFQFEFVTSAKKAALEEDFIKEGAIIHHIASKRNLFKYLLDIKRIVANNYDIIHFHKNSAANILPLIICRICGVEEIFVHSHNTAPSQGVASRLLHKINKRMLNNFANEKYACSTDAGKWMYVTDDYKILRNGIFTSKFLYSEDIRKKIRKELKIEEDAFVIGHVGRFTVQKNHAFLVEIFKEILSLNENSVLILVGTGDLENEILNKIDRMGLQKKVLMIGNRKDIPELMMAMDSFVMPSLYEGLPIVAVEAQAAGLNVFLSDRISKETEITNAVHWVELNSSSKIWAETIIKSFSKLKSETRLQRNSQVISNKYDICETVSELQRDYRRIKI